jgi:hypothetical protein
MKVHRPDDEIIADQEADQEIDELNSYCCPSCEKEIKGGYEWDESPLNPLNKEQTEE